MRCREAEGKGKGDVGVEKDREKEKIESFFCSVFGHGPFHHK